LAIHVNIFGAPSSGKSTMRSRLYYELKKRQLKVEEITEYAKGLTYGEDNIKLSDQLLVFGKQHHPHYVLDGKVDYIVTDSPFIMGYTYCQNNLDYAIELKDLMLKVNESYDSINYFLVRNHKYQDFGRIGTEADSDLKALEIKTFLINSNIDFKVVKSGEEFIETVLKDLGIE